MLSWGAHFTSVIAAMCPVKQCTWNEGAANVNRGDQSGVVIVRATALKASAFFPLPCALMHKLDLSISSVVHKVQHRPESSTKPIHSSQQNDAEKMRWLTCSYVHAVSAISTAHNDHNKREAIN